ncbi:hypothetical protein BDQ94DRAFT_177775 [Aspergillus welwitschiae]|uniref:Uncharacterized protein n=1 Tax=Aspergillus welwitschiae TaxID=1341132 RepID=A0A3F3PHW4_9EURO|nr:hypothetical protein BDQ94DRAFT_177775 [Aspergillus welwitschiae]RDH26457.1 hypothetical protein BDQ94DRAFT_177775 [Aspergillus welwitschiae]
MDEQRSLPPLEEINTLGSREALRTDERLGGVATAAEGFTSIAAPVRQRPKDTSATEPVEDHRNSNVSTERRVDRACAACVRRKIKLIVFSHLALRGVPEKWK